MAFYLFFNPYSSDASYDVDIGGGSAETLEGGYKAFAFAWSGAADPSQDDFRSYVLSNELGEEGEGGLIDQLIAAGYGSQNLYQILQYLAAQPGSNIPADFVESVGNNLPGSEVFTATLNDVVLPGNNPIGINADGELIVVSIYGRDHDGDVGFVSSDATIAGVAQVRYTYASNASYYINLGNSSVPGEPYMAIGIAWTQVATRRTFMLSNEAPGYLIDKLIAAGHGNESMYQVLQFLAAQPGSGIPADFVTEVGSSPAGSEVFTAALSNFSSAFNNPIGISGDGTLIVAQIYGHDYDGNTGFVTHTVQYAGTGLAKITMTTSPSYYIDAGTLVSGQGITTYYEAIGIAWAGAADPPQDDFRTYVLSNELGAEGEGGLIDQLIAAGHGNDTLYQILVLLAVQPGSNIPADFVTSVGSNLPGSEVFTATLNDVVLPGNNPIGINADGALLVVPIYGRDHDGQTGFDSSNGTIPGVARVRYTLASDPYYYIDAGTSQSGGVSGQHYYAIGIAWSNSFLTFVLSNESPGHLIDELIAYGYGNGSFYEALVSLQEASGGVITDAFLEILANCPSGSEIFTVKLSDYAGISNAVGINADGTLKILDIRGRDYFGQTGYATYPETQSGLGRELFTYATSPQYYIDAGSNGTSSYEAFAIAWSGEADPPQDDFRSYVLSNELGAEGEGGLIDQLIAAGYGDDTLYQILVLLAAQPGSNIPADFVESVGSNFPESDVFNAAISDFAGLNGPVCINADGTLRINPIFARDYDGVAGYVSSNGTIPGVARVRYTLASDPGYYIDAGTSQSGGVSGQHYYAIGIAWTQEATRRTFMLSNEAPGNLIDKLITAGHGNESLYQVLQFLAAQPGSGIPADFVTEVGNSPAGSDVFTAALNNFSDASNNPIGIGADGHMIIAPIYGQGYDGHTGYATHTVQYTGAGLAKITMATSPMYYIDAGASASGQGYVNNYEAIGIAWAGAADPPQDDFRSYVLSNELGAEGEGGLIDQLIAAGYGSQNLYQILQLLAAQPGSNIPADFVESVGSNFPESDVFNAALSDFAGLNGPVCINADGTLIDLCR